MQGSSYSLCNSQVYYYSDYPISLGEIEVPSGDDNRLFTSLQLDPTVNLLPLPSGESDLLSLAEQENDSVRPPVAVVATPAAASSLTKRVQVSDESEMDFSQDLHLRQTKKKKKDAKSDRQLSSRLSSKKYRENRREELKALLQQQERMIQVGERVEAAAQRYQRGMPNTNLSPFALPIGVALADRNLAIQLYHNRVAEVVNVVVEEALNLRSTNLALVEEIEQLRRENALLRVTSRATPGISSQPARMGS